MIEWLGLIYTVAKDIRNRLKCGEQEGQIDRDWLEKSSFHAEAEANYRRQLSNNAAVPELT
ncbi:hypothetical protein FSO04_30875 [Paraburkholderia madseniana]|uniref:Uncharacterized protein n=1 Tax=Paraburkholderia madseniana TaxID=2599607 RepID=A0A6N6W986_9BURK|nr:hypothetical protein [Paraburkholderia madseniana]KAE8756110.1 hypothetical protein FSO04_30875 [Paraburkholderia madseniana]